MPSIALVEVEVLADTRAGRGVTVKEPAVDGLGQAVENVVSIFLCLGMLQLRTNRDCSGICSNSWMPQQLLWPEHSGIRYHRPPSEIDFAYNSQTSLPAIVLADGQQSITTIAVNQAGEELGTSLDVEPLDATQSGQECNKPTQKRILTGSLQLPEGAPPHLSCRVL